MSIALAFLGGVGEVGKNFTVIEVQGRALVIDCGLRFPNVAEHPGIDLIIPDFSYLRTLGDGLLGPQPGDRHLQGRLRLQHLLAHDITISLRAGYLRFAPHFYNSATEIALAVATTRDAVSSKS